MKNQPRKLSKDAHKFRANQQNPKSNYNNYNPTSSTCWDFEPDQYGYTTSSTTTRIYQNMQKTEEESYPYTELTLDLLTELFAGSLSRFFYWTKKIEEQVNEKFLSGIKYGVSFIPISRVKYVGSGVSFSTNLASDIDPNVRFNISLSEFNRAEKRRQKKTVSRLKLTNEEFISIYSVEYSELNSEEDENFETISTNNQNNSGSWLWSSLSGIGTDQDIP